MGPMIELREAALVSVVRVFRVDPKRVLMRRRGELRESDARAVAMAILRDQCGMTVKEIGSLFGRDHTTVSYAYKKVLGMAQVDRNFRDRLSESLRLFCRERRML